MQTKNKFMNLALEEARKAFQIGEVPVGAVIVCNGNIVGQAHNLKELIQDATMHAEINAIRQASKALGTWRLENCDMYVTLEPCPMCAGAIIQARIKNLYIATEDPKGGACGSVVNLFSNPWNHQVNVEFGIMKEESSKLLKDFFKLLRE
ncbi:MAG TPA: nucleoside deaminase [Acholeplasmataceae bacterium]|jgi:tRNA(adenine34) deaminase|nr:nucleoside deaminase [Acholeplasmataceae bacterium]HPX71489.1 nucleoside deaminase [Acholeplasmataceae bacterium]